MSTSSTTHATIWIYPWDLLDEGIDATLARLRQDMDLDALSVATSYHTVAHLRPHSPADRWFVAHDAAVYFQPQLERYAATRLKPNVSPLAQHRNPLADICAAARGHGLQVISWTVCLHNTYLGRTHPDCAVQTAYGDALTSDLCPANPDVRAYHLALTGDVAANYRPDLVFVESPGYLAYNYGWSNPKVQTPISPRCEFLLSLCFCAHCVGGAERSGLDGGRLKERVAGYLRRELPELPSPQPPVADARWQAEAFDGDLARFLDVRANLALEAYEAIAGECRRHGAGVFGFVPLVGGDEGPLARVHGLLDRGLCGLPASGRTGESVAASKRALRPNAELIAHGHPGSCATKEEWLQRVQAARAAGADGFGCYNYGLVRPEHLRWVGEAVEAWSRAG
jgi:hypothetical protein